jgi:hypothetical protein
MLAALVPSTLATHTSFTLAEKFAGQVYTVVKLVLDKAEPAFTILTAMC